MRVRIHYCHKYHVIFCISSVQISTTVLRELPLYWANGIKGLSVCVSVFFLYVFKIHCVKSHIGFSPQIRSLKCVCAFDFDVFSLKPALLSVPTRHIIHQLCDPAL